MKTHEIPKANGSIRMTNNHMIANKNSHFPAHQKSTAANHQQQKHRPSIEIEEINEGKIIEEPKVNGNGQSRRNLMKAKTEELKYIDTSCESDLPPTLSGLQQRKSVQIEENPIVLASPTTTLATTIISLENEHQQLNPINDSSNEDAPENNVGTNVQTNTARNSHDMGVDSAVEESTVSLEQVMYCDY